MVFTIILQPDEKAPVWKRTVSCLLLVAKLCVSAGKFCTFGTLSLLCSTSVPKGTVSVLPRTQAEVKVCDISLVLDSASCRQ